MVFEVMKICPVIKVIGVGGVGCNALSLMFNHVRGVEFIAIDNNMQAPKDCHACTHLQIGVADEIEFDRARIACLIKDADLIFIVSGIDDAVGTLFSSLIAKFSRERRILTIAVVSTPLECDEKQRLCVAKGINELCGIVDSLIVVSIADLMKLYGIAVPDVFLAANGLMRDAVLGIAELFSCSDWDTCYFNDLMMTMDLMGRTVVASATASGSTRSKTATERAISSPLIPAMVMTNAHFVLVNITANTLLSISEKNQVEVCMKIAAPKATVIMKAIFDESMGDEMRVTVVAPVLDLCSTA